MSEDKLSRKDIKRDIREDEVGTFLQTTLERAYEQRSLLAKIGAALVALVVVLMVGSAFNTSRKKAATQDLVDAVKVFTAPIEGEEGADEADGPTFATVEARRTAAKEKLDAVGGGVAADVAGLYLADLAVEEGDTATARTLWQGFVNKHGDHLLAQGARLNLISLDRDEGRGEEVVASLQSELEKTSKALSEDVLLFELGKTLEALDRDEEAKTYFQRILDEHASSPYVADARQRTGEGANTPTLGAATSLSTNS